MDVVASFIFLGALIIRDGLCDKRYAYELQLALYERQGNQACHKSETDEGPGIPTSTYGADNVPSPPAVNNSAEHFDTRSNKEHYVHTNQIPYIKGALYRIYQVRILCRRFPAKFSAIVSPALVMHDSVHRRDLRGS